MNNLILYKKKKKRGRGVGRGAEEIVAVKWNPQFQTRGLINLADE